MPSFRTELLTSGKTATGFEVPPSIVEELGGGKRAAVQVTLNGYQYPSTLAVMGGRFLVPVSADVRAAAGVAGGDSIEVTLELDTKPRVIEVPPDLAEALAKHPEAKAAFETLSYSKQRAITYPIEHAKKPETRERRVMKAIEDLES